MRRRVIWAAAAVAAVTAVAFGTVAAGADDAPVAAAAAAPATNAVASDLDDVDSLRTTTTTTTTTEATTTTTAAPTTTAPPATAPPTTAAPTTTAPPPPPPTTAAPAPAAAPAPSAPQNGTRNTGCEQFMYDHINAARADAGVHALAFDSVIQYIAVRWSDHLAGTQVLAHNPNYADQILAHRDYRTAGENVGRGRDLARLFQAFMDSPGHRQNILAGVSSHVTVGCVTDASGQLWVTQNFWGS